VPPRPGGELDVSNALIAVGAGLVAVVASLWIVYTLEIVKARHLHAIGLGRFAPPVDEAAPGEEDVEEALERALTPHGPKGRPPPPDGRYTGEPTLPPTEAERVEAGQPGHD